MKNPCRCAVTLMLLCGPVSLLGGCASNHDKQSATDPASLYCAHYLIYDMCVQDLDKDGGTDLMYFQDTGEVFMYDQSWQQAVYSDFELHPCVQVMDDDMKQASSRLLTLPRQHSFMKKMAIQQSLLEHYSRYSSRVRACKEALAATAPAEAPFGDGDLNNF
ncbi:hypothetical protein [Pseudomaricurvus sp. HS19]|uniref:hypothetical protein n=1 Tax=Pseudomaricurvus sp. HS19 TaxID=2692626 RepID=UPI00136DE8E7|nr:hypothetical protein [Pseudomaricurvus sp. HS19]MYM64184.1 hypothetical protein [Pseudomaricurvus sp. HS19]